MKTSQSEYLSALLDNEAGEFERRRLVDELCRDEGLGQELGRYALIGETLRARRTVVLAKTDFLAGIQHAIETEPAYHETVVLDSPMAANDSAPWHTRPLLRYGMAAGLVLAVAAGVMWMEQPAQRGTTERMAEVVASNTEAEDPTRLAAAPVMPRQGHLNEETREILRQYVTQHVKYASTTAIVPSVRAVASRDY
ncbi:MAG TPA: sigma-E factor negative regulatory protein [Thiolinea sp.]|nr:sigma-E factor negative regulatory protein [Thiolinea sp.]